MRSQSLETLMQICQIHLKLVKKKNGRKFCRGLAARLVYWAVPLAGVDDIFFLIVFDVPAKTILFFLEAANQNIWMWDRNVFLCKVISRFSAKNNLALKI